MTGDYTGKRYRKMRATYRDDCHRNRRPCSICRQPIDYSLTFPHPGSWELHHVRPSSTHPDLHYVRSNWAASHSLCNKSHSDKPAPSPDAWIPPSW